MKKLIHEIHRRSLWQVLAIYLGGSWLVLQVVDTMAGALSLPDWSASFALFALVIGLPIVLATAFVQEGVTKRNAAAVQDDVERAQTASSEAPSEPESTPGRHLLSWKNAIIGGLGAFALLGVLSAGWLASRSLGVGPAATLVARGVIDDQATVVLADFQAADREVAGAATEALRVDLSQSNAVRLMDRALVAEGLGRMGRDPTTPLTSDVAREIAEREGAAGIVAGDIGRAGVGYVFSAQILSVDGTTLTSQRETAADSTQVLDAIERLSKRLRERLGESLGSMRASPPLERVTTANLEALRLFSRAEGLKAMGQPGARPYYEQAIAADSGFAMAWYGLGIILNNSQTERGLTVEAFTRAYELGDRLTERERRLATAHYYGDVLFDQDRAAIELDALLQNDPMDRAAIVSLGVYASEARRFDLAVKSTLQSLALNADGYVPSWWNLVQGRINLGQFAEARAAVDSIERRFGPGPGRYTGSIVAGAEGDFERADSLLVAILGSPAAEDNEEFVSRVEGDLAALSGARGRAQEASRHLASAARLTRVARPIAHWQDMIQYAWIELDLRGEPQRALALLDQAEAAVPLQSLAPLDRPYAALAELYARSGEVSSAKQMMSALEAAVDPELRRTDGHNMGRAEGEIAFAEGRYGDAVDAFHRADFGFCTVCALPGLGAAYSAIGQTDSAVVILARYIETPYSDRYASYAYPRGPALGPILERLAQLHDERAEYDEAAKYYAMFVELWAEADEELQPRVRAAQARLEEILSEIG